MSPIQTEVCGPAQGIDMRAVLPSPRGRAPQLNRHRAHRTISSLYGHECVAADDVEAIGVLERDEGHRDGFRVGPRGEDGRFTSRSKDPLIGMYSAASRASLDGSDAWTLRERVGIDRALEAYTVHGARAWHLEKELGRLAPGMKADVVAWSGDLLAHESDPSRLLTEHAELTIVGGRIEHSRGALADRVGAVVVDPVLQGSPADPHAHETP